ncbi:MAG: hypothetical protein IJH32_01525 [Ruminococcus sp.]|nr:hypothetical protein [Ruminococcus sp.]
MNCKQCGAIIPDGGIICPYCGFDTRGPSVQTLNNSQRFQQPVQAQYIPPQPQPQYIPPQQPVAPAYVTPQQQADANSVLIFGILGLAFACTFWLSFLGIIFSAIDRGKVKDYLYRYGVLYGKSKVGNILSRIGLPVAIVLTALAVFYTIYLIAIAGTVAYYY